MENVVARVNEINSSLRFDDWLRRGQGWWKARAGRIIECDRLFVINADNVVMAEGQIEGVRKDLEKASGRTWIDVRPNLDSKWIGKKIQRPGSRNPVVYIADIQEA